MTDVAVVAHDDKLSTRDRKRLSAALEDAGIDATWFTVAKAKKAGKATGKAVKAGARTVIVCGGDGTVRAAAEALVGTDTALAVLPVGTANLFATGFSLPSDPADVVAMVTGGARRTIDSGRCNGMTFNVMAGTGLDAAMIDDADASKDRLGMLAYVRAAIRSARGRDVFDAEVMVDGMPFFEGRATCVLVGNIGTIKGKLDALPDASPTDGKLDVAVVTAAGLTQWAGVLASAVRRRQASSGHAHIGQGADISVELGETRRFQLDGGTKGTTDRLEFSIEPRSLTLCSTPSG